MELTGITGAGLGFLSLVFQLGFGAGQLTAIDTVRALDTLDIYGNESFWLASELGLGYWLIVADLGFYFGSDGALAYYDTSADQRNYLGTGGHGGAYADVGLHSDLPLVLPVELAGCLRAGYMSVNKHLDLDTCSYEAEHSSSYAQLYARLKTPFAGVGYGYPISGSRIRSLDAFLAIPVSQLSGNGAASLGLYYTDHSGPEAGASSLGCLLSIFGFGYE